MNRVIVIDSFLALVAILLLGPGTSVLVQLAVRQAFALAWGNAAIPSSNF